MCALPIFFVFFFNDTATTEIYTLSLHDALPIYEGVDADLHRGRRKILPNFFREATCRGQNSQGAWNQGLP